MNNLISILIDPSFLGSIIGSVLSAIIAILIFKHGNNIEKKNQVVISISQKIYLMNLFKNDLKRLETSIETNETDQSFLKHLNVAKKYFLLFDNKVLSEKETKHILALQDLIIQFEYYFLFSASDYGIFEELKEGLKGQLKETDELLVELEAKLEKAKK